MADARRLARWPTSTELVHFCCTSEDINNLAYALMVRGAVRDVWLPAASALTDDIAALAHAAARPADAGPHPRPAGHADHDGQGARGDGRPAAAPARPDRPGRLPGQAQRRDRHLRRAPGRGARTPTGSAVSQAFVESLGLEWNPLTTQIESHDWQAELYADVARFNRVLHNVCTDIWTYISMGYFAQQLGAHGSTGSSTMPHKVNPIRFENAEANLEVSCALLDVLASTLVTSRLQRDLTDSSMQRTIGTAFGHSLLSIDNVRRGLAGARSRPGGACSATSTRAWEVLGEPIQSAMRAACGAGDRRAWMRRTSGSRS